MDQEPPPGRRGGATGHPGNLRVTGRTPCRCPRGHPQQRVDLSSEAIDAALDDLCAKANRAPRE
eukprot:1637546-Lingulodinium_polyedra.AAC.1